MCRKGQPGRKSSFPGKSRSPMHQQAHSAFGSAFALSRKQRETDVETDVETEVETASSNPLIQLGACPSNRVRRAKMQILVARDATGCCDIACEARRLSNPTVSFCNALWYQLAYSKIGLRFDPGAGLLRHASRTIRV